MKSRSEDRNGHPHLLSRAQIAFLLATKPLAALARVRNEEDWHALLYETKVCAATLLPPCRSPTRAARRSATITRGAPCLGQGLVDQELLYTAINWLQRDRPQF